MERALKIVVVALGLVLVGGTVALVAIIVGRAGQSGGSRPAAAGPGYHAALDLPAGARLIGATPDGNRLVVTLALAEGDEEIVIFDLTTGARLGTIELRAPR